MSSEHHSAITGLLSAILGLPVEKRVEALARLEEENPRQAADVRELLAADQAGLSLSLDEPLLSKSKLLEFRRAPDSPRLPDIPGFMVHAIVGQGGSCTVYSATQLTPRRSVALKVFNLHIAQAWLAERLIAEAHILARIEHPQVPRIYGTGSTANGATTTPYLVLEYICGTPMLEYARKHELDLDARLSLLESVFSTVGDLHDRGVFHRDLKPSNILICDSEPRQLGDVKIIDFGVAKFVDKNRIPDEPATLLPQAIGTLKYMSPNRVYGRSRGDSAADDVYSLGMIAADVLALEITMCDTRFAVASVSASPWLGRIPDDVSAAIALMLNEAAGGAGPSAHEAAHLVRSYLGRARGPRSNLRVLSRRGIVAFASAVLLVTVAAPFAFDLPEAAADNKPIETSQLEELSTYKAKSHLAADLAVNGNVHEAIALNHSLMSDAESVEELAQIDWLGIVVNHAYLLRLSGDLDAARRLYSVARRGLQLATPLTRKVSNTWTDAAHGLQCVGDEGTAESMYSALIRHEEFESLPWAERCHTLGCYGGFLWSAGRIDEAERTLRRSIAEPPSPLGRRERVLLAERTSSLGVIMRDQSRFNDARVHLENAFELAMDDGLLSDPLVCRLLQNLSLNELYAGRLSRSRDLCEQARIVWLVKPESWLTELCESDLILSTLAMKAGDHCIAMKYAKLGLDRTTAMPKTETAARFVVRFRYLIEASASRSGGSSGDAKSLHEAEGALHDWFPSGHPWLDVVTRG